MSDIFNNIYSALPGVLQNLMVTLYNINVNRVRFSGVYRKKKEEFGHNNTLSLIELKGIQQERLKELLTYVNRNSEFYKKLYEGIDLNSITSVEKLCRLPITKKESIRSDIDKVYTLKKREGVLSKTGGTTGKSLEVIFTKSDMQERMAMLDNFRAKHGYELGKKTAWFSGKSLLTKKDVEKKTFWKTDYWYHVRYYSTFHIQDKNLKYYIENLIDFMPEYMIGFPSSMYEIAKFGIEKKFSFPENRVKAIFPTAETMTSEIKDTLEKFFHSRVYDQYASSEGAPFIFECTNNNLHLELQSGVFEVLDEKDNPTSFGKLVVTSFTSHGTPLIRYDIGDEIELSNEKCSCGNENPLVKAIQGRINDFIFSPEVGKINLGNISNALKGVHGVRKFQVIQDSTEEIKILIVKDESVYTVKDERAFIKNFRERVGEKMRLNLVYVDDIPREKSGKFRLVKNNLGI